MAQYIELNPEKLEGFLRTCGFSRRIAGSEVVYVLANQYHPDVWVKVYTTIRKDTGRPRDKGNDSIKVSVAYESEIPFRGRTSFGIFKAGPILRTHSDESISDRLYTRMREAYAAANQWIRDNRQLLADAKEQFDADDAEAGRDKARR